MQESERIRDQLRRAFEGEAWHGPSVQEALSGVTAGGAAAHPVEGAHSIWEIVLHMAATIRLVLRRLGGDSTPLSAEEDWPPVPEISAGAWSAALQALREAHEEIDRAVSGLPDSRLDEPIIEGSPSSLYVTLHGVVQHNLYHAGQIALLKKGVRFTPGGSRGSAP